MSHCPGCGGHFREGGHANFRHILGCGWDKQRFDGRHAVSDFNTQKTIIKKGLLAAEASGGDVNAKAKAFIKAVQDELDLIQP